MSFAEQVAALQKFFGVSDDQLPLDARVGAMNSAMGIAAEGTLPEQVERLLAATGVSVASSSSSSEPPAAARRADAGTSLPIGMSNDPKLVKSLAKHAARSTKLMQAGPQADERGAKIAALRHLMEGGPDVPEKYRHADYKEEGNKGTQIAGGISYSNSMGHSIESEGFFKNVATQLAKKPAIRRCNPVGGMYPEFR